MGYISVDRESISMQNFYSQLGVKINDNSGTEPLIAVLTSTIDRQENAV